MKRKWLRRWWRADREELERARAENERLRRTVEELDKRVSMLTTLVRALRDVNADLDGKLNGGAT